MRQLLDEYLDGALGTDRRAELEQHLAKEPKLSALLSRMKQERALRAAAFAGFNATSDEATQVAQTVVSQALAPATIGYVGPWIKRIAGIAAVLALIAGSFAVGRTTAPKDVAAAAPQVIYRVMYYTDSGKKEVREFSELADADAFMNRDDVKRGAPQVFVADADLNQSGSF